MTERKTTLVTIDDGFFLTEDEPKTAKAVIALLQNQLSQIPAEHADSATISLWGQHEYGFGGSICYRRPETDEECQERIENETAERFSLEKYERQQLKKLIAKYGVPTADEHF